MYRIMKVEDKRYKHQPKSIALVTGGFDPLPVSYTHLTLPTNREV